MNTRALVRGISGKSLLAFACIVLLLGAVAGEAAAVTVPGQVTNVTNVTSGDPGPGVPNLFVVATTPAPNFTFLAQAQTDASGNYTIVLPNMPVGTNFLVFVDLTGTSLVSDLNDTIEKTRTFTGANLEPVDFMLVDGVKLSGKVTVQSTNLGADGVIVFATNPSLGWKFLGQATTGGDGTYGLLVPPDEKVELAVDKQGKFSGTVVDPPFLPVDVAKDEKSNLDFFLIRGVVVQGYVTDGVQSILNALVEAFFVSSDPDVGWVWLDDDTTGPNGFYSVAVAEWGEILLRVTATGFVERRVEVVLVSPTTTRDVVLSTSVQISGRVTDASNGNGIGGVPVEAYFGPEVFPPELTNADGSYTLDVPPNQGLVFIHVYTTTIDYLQPGDGEVVVGIVDFTGIDFALTPSVNISGTVTDADSSPPGAAIPSAGVTAFQGSLALAFALTDDPSGFYTLKIAVNQGVVDVHVDAGNFWQTADRLVTVGDKPRTENFALKRVVQTDSVTIKFAGWSKNVLTVFATSTLQPNATLKVTVLDQQGNAMVTNATMTFSTKRKQYEFRFRPKTDLMGGRVTVTSNKVGSASVPIPFRGECVNQVC